MASPAHTPEDVTFVASPDVFGRLMQAARSGDWGAVESLSNLVRTQNIPEEFEGTAEYMRSLKEALIVAKAARASLILNAHRLHAAAGFQPSGLDSQCHVPVQYRQDPGGPAES